MARLTFFLSSLLVAAPASAEWVVFADGQRTEVLAVEIAERAVHLTTKAGKRWSVMRDRVDVDATLAANQTRPPLEIVTVTEGPPVAPETTPTTPTRPETQTTLPPRPSSSAPQTIIEREPTPVPALSEDVYAPREPPSRAHRFSVTVNGVQGTETLSFADTNQFELFKESAQIESVYRDGRAQGFEVGAQFRIAGPFALGATVQRFDQGREASYTASLPHPFFFDRFRELSGAASGLTHEELAVHVDVALTQTWGPVTLDVFGGPSWFQTRTEVLVDVAYDEVFPYNEVFFRGVEGRVLETQPIGYNVGASATFRVAGFFGVDFGVRYSEARSKLFIEAGRDIELDAGGLSVGAGLRFLFP